MKRKIATSAKLKSKPPGKTTPKIKRMICKKSSSCRGSSDKVVESPYPIVMNGDKPVPQGIFYMRPMTDKLIYFSSPEGKLMFQRALLSGGMENYFKLAE